MTFRMSWSFSTKLLGLWHCDEVMYRLLEIGTHSMVALSALSDFDLFYFVCLFVFIWALILAAFQSWLILSDAVCLLLALLSSTEVLLGFSVSSVCSVLLIEGSSPQVSACWPSAQGCALSAE